MAYDIHIPGCFGHNDLLLAVHACDADRTFTWLTKLRRHQATWNETRAQIEEFLRDRGAAPPHIEEQVAAAKRLLAPWLYGPVDEE